ncbi:MULTISPECIES: acetylxylan esterase [unclassified Crossiella]|uniref:acetylxylan esterase n=1 Tax=unclassified Crossiella TaxID=2620835 RepID=UPI001FFEBBCE|nr:MULTISPECIES: acetylxylan esterase [unclassified Crossiella]MCK2241939.1 acetylxylan esterase [Crossiella sp. S99.2]MCK2255842.1 acetylxylan esterase [Crossiella sp. S99.1]
MTATRDPATAVLTVPRPPDFTEFWAQTLDGLPEPDAALAYLPTLSTDTVAVFDLRYTSYQDVEIAAWYAVPRGEGRVFPGLVTIPGYISEPDVPRYWAELGYATLSVAPRGKLRSNAVFNPGYPGLLTHNIVDHHTYGYRGFYADVIRALDVLAARPEVDEQRIGVQGSSQGGGLGIVSAALRPDLVRCFAAGAPYLCGIWASTKLTHSYPYEEITEYLRVHPEHAEAIQQSVAYYDGMNFAPLVRAPSYVYLGLEDDVCPPETGFAVFRELGGDKVLDTYAGCAHHAGLHWVQPKIEAFLAGHLTPEAVR